MSLNRDNYYKSLSLSNSKNRRKVKSVSYNKSISNKSTKLHSFITTGNKYNDFELTLVPNKTSLYQITDFDFEEGKKTIKDYYNYYNKKYNGAYSLSSYKVASINAKNTDKFKIIYTTLPNEKDLNTHTKKNNYEYIYPLYFIETPTTIIKYTINKNLNLIDIGNLKNVIELWNIINSLNIPNFEKEEYKLILYKSCAVINTNFSYNPPNKLLRNKTEENDIKLSNLFINIFKQYFKLLYNIDINGWIFYNKKEDFNDEIVITDSKLLIFNKFIRSKDYLGIPLYDEYKKKHDTYKIKINSIKNFRLLLSNLYSK